MSLALNPHCATCSSRGKSVFCDLSAEHLKEIDNSKTCNHYKPKQVIFYEGNTPQGLFCINTGKVKLTKVGIDGGQQILKLYGAGDILGYRSLLCQENYRATAEVLEDSKICYIDEKTFSHVLETHPATSFNVIRALAKDAGDFEQKAFDMVHKTIRQRFAELLMIFSRKFGKKASAGLELDISLSRQEMADLIGTTQESMIRLISDFKKEKLVMAEGRILTILDMAALADEADLYD